MLPQSDWLIGGLVISGNGNIESTLESHRKAMGRLVTSSSGQHPLSTDTTMTQ